MISRTLTLLASVALLVSCGGRQQSPQTAVSGTQTQRTRVFVPPVAPVSLTPEETCDYVKEHYWDNFDFTDTVFIREADPANMIEAFARYVILLSDEPTNGEPMREVMREAAVSRPMLDYFKMMADKVLHDPNSMLRNDELYIPVLETVIGSGYYDEYELLSPEYDLKLVSQNRLGTVANDIEYTLRSGKRGRLHRIEADYVLLFLSNPECPMCSDVAEAVSTSPMISELVERGSLKVLYLYPDEDLEAWRNHAEDVPSKWIYAYDAGCRLREQSTYNLSAIPALYLLDKEKKVIVKDATDVSVIEYVIDNAE